MLLLSKDRWNVFNFSVKHKQKGGYCPDVRMWVNTSLADFFRLDNAKECNMTTGSL